MRLTAACILLCFTSLLFSCRSKTTKDNLLLVEKGNQCGYTNSKGDTVIPLGKYDRCFTDTFITLAIVQKGNRFIGINRRHRELFEVYPFDNGPDEPSEGLFRIIRKGKIGYANVGGKVVIKPQFDCAYPFEEGTAKVSYNCQTVSDGEHESWNSDEWLFIDTSGKVLQ